MKNKKWKMKNEKNRNKQTKMKNKKNKRHKFGQNRASNS